MNCYKVTITGFIITGDDIKPPNEQDFHDLLGGYKHHITADAKVVLFVPADKPPQRACSKCGTLGHNRQTCPSVKF